MKSISIKTTELRSISGANNLSFLIKLIIYLIMIGTAVYITLLSDLPYFLGLILIGVTFAHGVELQHQALHGSGFSNTILNRAIGFLLGLPMLVSFSAYQYSHLLHHDKVGTKDDTEFFEFNTLKDGSGTLSKFYSFFLFSHYIEFIRRSLKSLFTSTIINGCNKSTNKKIRIEYLTMIVIISTLFSVVSYEMFLLWLIPLITVTAPIHSLIEFPEHFGCNNNSENIMENTRTIKSSSFYIWFTNGNNYHVEHHMYPLVRPEKLSVVNRALASEIVYFNSTYSEFFLESI